MNCRSAIIRLTCVSSPLAVNNSALYADASATKIIAKMLSMIESTSARMVINFKDSEGTKRGALTKLSLTTAASCKIMTRSQSMALSRHGRNSREYSSRSTIGSWMRTSLKSKTESSRLLSGTI